MITSLTVRSPVVVVSTIDAPPPLAVLTPFVVVKIVEPAATDPISNPSASFLNLTLLPAPLTLTANVPTLFAAVRLTAPAVLIPSAAEVMVPAAWLSEPVPATIRTVPAPAATVLLSVTSRLASRVMPPPAVVSFPTEISEVAPDVKDVPLPDPACTTIAPLPEATISFALFANEIPPVAVSPANPVVASFRVRIVSDTLFSRVNCPSVVRLPKVILLPASSVIFAVSASI